MGEQYYCLNLDDYSAASFTSFGKAYYGTLPQIRAFITAIEEDEERHKHFKKLIDAFHEYEAGNTEVKHNVAYQEIPLLEPVRFVAEMPQRYDSYQWEHLNTWRWPYYMRCSCVETKHIWIKANGYYTRCILARFENLAYTGFKDQWSAIGGAFWGFPHIIEVDGRFCYNRLAVEEKRFKRKSDMMEDRAAFPLARDVNFTEFCNDIFGDG